MTNINKRTVLVILLLLLAATLRLYRINVLTEFLGDQGRTGIIIWNAWVNKTLPLIGPPVLSGQFLGPFFYFFIAPSFIFSGFNPLAPAIFISLIGVMSVYGVYWLGKKLFGYWIGFSISVMYAISHSIISADRTLWEPSVIPFFVLLYVISLYFIYAERKFFAFLPMGIIVGILIQLHYPNIFYIGLSTAFLCYILATKRNKESAADIFLWFFAGILGFFLIVSPFLYYEFRHNWKDLKEIALTYLLSGSSPVDTRPFYQIFFDLASRVFYHIFPITTKWMLFIIQIVIIGVVVLRKQFWGLFFGFWFVFGIAAMSLYKGIVFDHYLNFLLPLPFLLLGFSFTKLPRIVTIVIVFIVITLQVQKLDIFRDGTNDIARTEGVVKKIIEMTGNEPFSFTLISSRSFSDLHYRYFFLLNHIQPAFIADASYQTLFLVCEQSPCPSSKEMKGKPSVQAICYEEHCSGLYPTVDLTNWQLIATSSVLDGKIYVYKRKINPQQSLVFYPKNLL